MTLVLGEAHRDQIHAHVEQAYPDEACGLLVGALGRSERRVERVEAVNNAAGADRARRYVVDPGDFLTIERRARADGLEVLGFYHSHPDHPGEPSPSDHAEALPHYTYLIAEVRSGHTQGLRAWRFEPEGNFAPETVVMVAAAGQPGSGAG